MNLRKLRWAIILYAMFDLYVGGYCGGFLPLNMASAAAQTTGLLSQGQLGVSCNAITAATSNNPGTAGGCTALALLTSGGALPGVYTWQVITTGSPATVTVTLQGSLDGVTWTQLDTTSAAGTRTTSSGAAYRFLGCIPSALTGGTSPTVTCQISVTSTPASTGSGTVSANSGSAGAIAKYAAAGGSTTVSPDANLTDASSILTYNGTFLSSSGTSGACSNPTNGYAVGGVGNNINIQVGSANTLWLCANSATASTIVNSLGVQAFGYQTNPNCQLGGATGTASPAACAGASAGMIAIPASQTTYTVNSTLVTANSEIFIQQMSDNSGLPSSPTCNATATNPIQSGRVAGTSFTFTLTTNANVTCYKFWLVN